MTARGWGSLGASGIAATTLGRVPSGWLRMLYPPGRRVYNCCTIGCNTIAHRPRDARCWAAPIQRHYN